MMQYKRQKKQHTKKKNIYVCQSNHKIKKYEVKMDARY